MGQNSVFPAAAAGRAPRHRRLLHGIATSSRQQHFPFRHSNAFCCSALATNQTASLRRCQVRDVTAQGGWAAGPELPGNTSTAHGGSGQRDKSAALLSVTLRVAGAVGAGAVSRPPALTSVSLLFCSARQRSPRQRSCFCSPPLTPPAAEGRDIQHFFFLTPSHVCRALSKL